MAQPFSIPHYRGVGARNEEFDFLEIDFSVDVWGGKGDDVIFGGSAVDSLWGAQGSDLIYGGDGSDIIFGDTIQGDSLGAADALAGGNGDDLIFAGGGNDFVEGGEGLDDLIGDSGNDSLYGGFGADNIEGGNDDDILWGGSPPDSSGLLEWNAGRVTWNGIDDTAITSTFWTLPLADASTDTSRDWLSGGQGDDTLFGQRGNDVLIGGYGNDVLEGGLGSDSLSGGPGADRFVFTVKQDSLPSNPDWIDDFNFAQSDKIVLSKIDANSLQAGNQAFTFIGKAAFSGDAGELRAVYQSGVTNVLADINGDKVADFGVIIDHRHSLIAADFIL